MSWKVGGGGGGGECIQASDGEFFLPCQSSSKFLPAAVAPTHFCSSQTSSSFRRLKGFPFLSEADRRSLFFAAARFLLPQLSAFPSFLGWPHLLLFHGCQDYPSFLYFLFSSSVTSFLLLPELFFLSTAVNFCSLPQMAAARLTLLLTAARVTLLRTAA